MVTEVFERQPSIEHQRRMRSFIYFLLTIVAVFVCVAHGDVKEKEVHSWLQDIDHVLRDRKRFPTATRLKSGPTPGSWYYIMGHRKDSKRSSSLFSSPFPSSSASSYYGSPSQILPVEDNVIPQLLPDLLPGSGGFSHLMRAHSPFAFRPPPKTPRPDAGSLDGPTLPLGAFPLVEEEEAEESPVGVDRETEEASGRMLLKDFLQFLRMKEEKTLDGCIPSTSQSKTD